MFTGIIIDIGEVFKIEKRNNDPKFFIYTNLNLVIIFFLCNIVSIRKYVNVVTQS